jgi:hypothetical protein
MTPEAPYRMRRPPLNRQTHPGPKTSRLVRHPKAATGFELNNGEMSDGLRKSTVDPEITLSIVRIQKIDFSDRRNPFLLDEKQPAANLCVELL